MLGETPADKATFLLSAPAFAPRFATWVTPVDKATFLLSAPAFAPRFSTWVAYTELMTSSLKLFGISDIIKTIVFHPDYSRAAVEPSNSLKAGHLPPLAWMPNMMRSALKGLLAEDFDYSVSDFQRRAPCPAINVLRAEMMDTFVTNTENIVSLDDGRHVRVSGARVYCANTRELAAVGAEALEAALHKEMEGLAVPLP
ncbi:hypothetical protein JKP88DRAFT_325630 [Tribonema minus]|uniref:Uncharacterized protein n=1 Tax=Tribonema minus TaxID=303371 RepID=A0A836CC65_9STRA|nr:hypothetical protein JKP88DRAFT_325630 [Tribonema minus]